jgi:DNA primase
MQKQLDQAMPMVQLLWRRETEGKNFDSPERKAALDRSLRNAILKLRDPSLRRHYGDEVNRLRRTLFDGDRSGASGRNRPFIRHFSGKGAQRPPAPPTAEVKASALVAAGAPFEEQMREAVILATLVSHPTLVQRFVAELERLDTAQPDHRAICDALLSTEGGERSEIEAVCGREALEKLFHPRHVRIAPGVDPDANDEVAEMCVAEELAKLSARRGARREIAEAIQDVEGLADEGLTWRLGQAAEARNMTERSGNEDTAEYDLGPNGARMKRDEKDAFESLIGRIEFAKSRGKSP